MGPVDLSSNSWQRPVPIGAVISPKVSGSVAFPAQEETHQRELEPVVPAPTRDSAESVVLERVRIRQAQLASGTLLQRHPPYRIEAPENGRPAMRVLDVQG